MKIIKIIILLFFLLKINKNYSQEKSRWLERNETLITKINNKSLKLESFVEEKKQIPKGKKVDDYTLYITCDNLNTVSDIKGYVIENETKKKTKLYNIFTEELNEDYVFHSDNKLKKLVFVNSEKGATIDVSYKMEYKDPHLLGSFCFQDYLATVNSKFQIKAEPSIEIGYKLLGNNTDKINFTKTKEGKLDVYTWEIKDVEAFKTEVNAPNHTYFIPHLAYYIKSYTIKDKKTEVFSDIEKLYQWSYSLVKDSNKMDSEKLKNKALELTKDIKNETEKAKIIYNWIQQNINYVALEYEMGGFIPRDAQSVFDKKYGDCKDMANLLNEMLKTVNIKSGLTWIGTHQKPYKFSETPLPLVSNHMIVSTLIEGKRYFLDSTNPFCIFGYPTDMIQGKEALIGISEKEFLVETVPIMKDKDNKKIIEMNLKIFENNLEGNVKASFLGYQKNDVLVNLSNKENESAKKLLSGYNEKLELEIKDITRNEYKDQNTDVSYKLKLENWIKKINEQLIFKPILLFSFKDFLINIEKRKLPIQRDYAYTNEFNYSFEIPEGYKFDFVPENYKNENELIGYEINYKKEKKKLIVNQKINVKTLIVETGQFEKWNNAIKDLNKQYNQAVILKK